MPAATELILLLSLGSFQATLPQMPGPAATSPVFPDTPKGVSDFVAWFKSSVPEPGFNQPATKVCVVGAVPFSAEKPPHLPKPLWESKPPLRQLEPYSATFHYVELKAGDKVPPPRTLKDARTVCARAWASK